MNYKRTQLTICAIPALVVAFATQLSAQTDEDVRCGPGGRNSFKLAQVASRDMLGASGTAVPRNLDVLCAPPTPNFIGEDSKQLLAKIKLAKAQNDSSGQLAKSFTARQKVLGDQKLADIAKSREAPTLDTKTYPGFEARRVHLTPQMQELRAQYASAVRALLTPEQVTQFETNLAALKAKDAKGDG